MLVDIDLKVTIIIIILNYFLTSLTPWKIIEKYFVNLALILKTHLQTTTQHYTFIPRFIFFENLILSYRPLNIELTLT